ncbi:putative mitochondrial protein [Trifolium repens]|nr:putative mitochondrial protein [Trifolium repens]
MRRALGAKNKLSFIDGSLPIPDLQDLNRSAWERCNHLIHSWIINSVSDSIAQTLVFHETAIDAWEDLRERFAKIDRICISTLRNSLNNLKQGTKSVLDYFTEMRMLWEELNSHRPMPHCTCVHQCRCEAMRAARNYRVEDQIIQFLTGLNEHFAVVKTQILLMDPLPSMNKVYSLVIQEESNNSSLVNSVPSASVDDSNILVNAVDSKKSQNRGKGPATSAKGKDNRHCTYCDRGGHTVDGCFKKHGYPNPRSNSAANSIDLEGGNGNSSNGATVVASTSSNIGISQEQYNQLVSLLQQSNANSSAGPSTNHIHTTPPSPNDSGCISSTMLPLHNIVSCSIHSNSSNWLLDSGASDHVCSLLHWFNSFHSIKPLHVNLPNGHTVIVTHAGSVSFSPSLYLHNVLYSPDFKLNLISVAKLSQSLFCVVHFYANKCVIQDMKSKRTIGLGDHVDGLYKLTLHQSSSTTTTSINHTNSTDSTTPLDCFSNLSCNNDSSTINKHIIPSSALWHFRFGHLSNNRLSKMTSLYPSISCDNKAICDVCHFAKQKKLPYLSSKSHAQSKFELLHFDIWGPLAVPSIHGHKYFLTIVDDFSRFVWIILLKNKSVVSAHVQSFITMVETQFHVTPKIVRSDNGPEFLLDSFYSTKGIIHHRSCVENPQQNGRVERKHQHILNVGRALLFQSKLPKVFWSYAVSHAVFLINRVTTSLLDNKSPHQLLYDSIPDISLYKVFGCLCFASTLDSHRSKLDSRARKCVFLGYKTGFKGSILYDLHTKEVFISRNVTFYEHILPYHVQSPSMTSSWTYTTPPTNSTLNPATPNATTLIPTSQPNPTIIPNSDSLSQITETEPDLIITPNHDPLTQSVTSQPPNIPCHVQRQSTRSKQPPSHLKDYICSSITDHPRQQSSGSLYPLSKYISYSKLSPSHCLYALSLTVHTEPKSYAEAVKFDCWRKAMQAELLALEKTGTWFLVDKPLHVKPIGCRWVYKVKHHANGTVERYKARLVAKGYNQIEGLDYFDTYSPVAKLTTVRLVIALASIHHWFLHQLDVNNAFLHGDLQEDVYMTPPPNITAKPNQVCKLVKSIYGLKQASRKWYEKLTSLLLSHNYKQAASDHSMFTKQTASTFTILLVYVDDIILAGNSLSEFVHIKTVLHSAFKIKDLGLLKYFLGLEVAHSSTGITICQRKYCLDLLTDSGLGGCKPVSTPSDPSIKLYNDTSPPFEDVSAYRRLVGRLLYLNTTRPDITFITQQLSQFLSSPTHTHYTAALRVLRYLKGCPGRGLFFARSSSLHLQGFSDADWAGCKDSRRSISGQCFFLGQSLISWRTKKQLTVARSSSEAEYRALASATCELQWLLYLLRDLCITLPKTPVLFCDNQSALHIAANPVFHERTKHLDIDCHIVREKLMAGIMKLLHVTSKGQLADFFTKTLLPQPFSILVSKLGLVDIYQPPT